jgi:eukaryotic-like serine/threonine-protein kinase
MNRWQQVEKICQSALELEESQRAAFLEDACGGDEELRREVESLLRFDKRGQRFIEQPAVEVAAKMVAQEEPESLLGQQLGSYQILSLLGAGGMGVVYKARDTRLNRSVAIKVLPADRMSDPERKRRFIQEARAASALNHPNIITLHDIGSESGIDFIVMEYVAGKTLDQRIPRKGMRLNEALKLAIQMADALAKAHSAGIIHRDLKPTNVMVTEDDLVKVLDFGLAKLTEVVSTEETRTLEPQTETGTIVGTVSYMSPEQAEGRRLDGRSDIFSFGAVLYELISGQKAFEGDSKVSTLAAILKQEPKPISQLVSGIPPILEKTINRCLRKNPARRFQHMGDVKVELEDLREQSDSGAVDGAALAVRSIWQPLVWTGAAIVVAAIATAVWFLQGSGKQLAPPPEVVPLTTDAGFERSPSFSPDGNQVAFSWNGEKQDNFDIYIKLIGSPKLLQLTTDTAEDISPAFSPDGRSIGFVRASKEHATFMVIPAIGGPERVVAEVPAPDPYVSAPSFAWFPDGKWVVTDGLALISTEGSETSSLTSPTTKGSRDFSPAVSPDGHTIAFSRSAAVGFGASDIYVLDLTEDRRPRGEPRRLTFLKGYNLSSAWTPNREIIFTSGVFQSGSLWKVPASGAGKPEQLLLSGQAADWPAISRNGNRLAYQRAVSDVNIWRLALSGPGVASGSPTRLIDSTRLESSPHYSPDGKRIAFESDRSGVYGTWVSDAHGSNAVELFLRTGWGCGTAQWSPDMQRVTFDCVAEGNLDIYVMRANGRKPTRLTTHAASDMVPSWSGDGNWVYFASDRTGRWDTWKVPAESGEAMQVTLNGGGKAFESRDGKSIYYTKGDYVTPTGLWKMPVSGGEESQVLPSVVSRAFSLGKDGVYFIPEAGTDGKSSIQFLSFGTAKVKTVAPISGPPAEGLSVSPDGRSLLFSQVDEEGSDLMLVENFR